HAREPAPCRRSWLSGGPHRRPQIPFPAPAIRATRARRSSPMRRRSAWLPPAVGCWPSGPRRSPIASNRPRSSVAAEVARCPAGACLLDGEAELEPAGFRAVDGDRRPVVIYRPVAGAVLVEVYEAEHIRSLSHCGEQVADGTCAHRARLGPGFDDQE